MIMYNKTSMFSRIGNEAG